MRFSDNHDEKRAIARFGERGAMAASVLVFTLDGVPMLYNGMEAGDTTESGAPALFEKLPVFWTIAERRPEFPKLDAQMIALRRSHTALQQSETIWIPNADPDRILTFYRRGGGEKFLVAINCSSRPFFGTIEAARQFEDVTARRQQAGCSCVTGVVPRRLGVSHFETQSGCARLTARAGRRARLSVREYRG